MKTKTRSTKPLSGGQGETALGGAAGRVEVSASEHPRFRPDVDGLRAVAILAVVGYHAGVPGFSGGFVGVDVFFVISGFLITRNLLREAEGGHRVRLLAFWARRIRRLVPAMAAMVLGTLALSLVILSPLEWARIAKQGAWAALYVSNIQFARASQDYFAPDLGASPFLHTWSLGVEEQFYLLWPVLFVLAALVATWAGASNRRLVVYGFGVVAVVSFGLSVVMTEGIALTEAGSPWAFFSLPTRAWEFAVAGVLAAVALPRLLGARGPRMALGVVGLALIAAATVWLSDADLYPGWLALLPVVGTVLVIAAGEGAAPVGLSRALGVGPLQSLGRVSYSWYLWHWPLIILAIAAFNEDSTFLRLGACLVALGVAAVVYVGLETPLRFARFLVSSKLATYAFGGLVTAVTLAAAFSLVGWAGQKQQEDPWHELRSLREEFSDFRSEFQCGGPDARRAYCILGDESSNDTVAFVGDSHARQWVPAFDRAAAELGARVVVRWDSSCPAIDVPLTENNTECQAFRQETEDVLHDLDVDAVVVSQSLKYGPGGGIATESGSVANGDQAARIWSDAYREFLTHWRDNGVSVGAIVDNPISPLDPVLCMARHGVSADRCRPSRDEALGENAPFWEVEQKVRDELGSVLSISTKDEICPDDPCRLRVDGNYVFVDTHHLSQDFVLAHVTDVRRLLSELVGGQARFADEESGP